MSLALHFHDVWKPQGFCRFHAGRAVVFNVF
jgi:hypothetical protein